jgi:dihydrofolate synthase/folylpolyglutamate synthase
MTYEEAREFIKNANQYGIVPGLGTITELLKRLGDPQEQLRIIHVAGTNGKGSTSSFIATILAAAGFRVGRYLSPAVFSYREIIQIVEEKQKQEAPDIVSSQNSLKEHHTDSMFENQESIESENISRDGVVETLTKIIPVCEAMTAEGLSHPTSFEIETAMAFLYLLWEKVDYAVVEVGMGGRLDSTNVIRNPVCSVITSISMDHNQFLGDTLTKIAIEKAGIIKQGVPIITCNQDKEVIQVIKQKAKEKDALLTIADLQQITQIRHSLEAISFIDSMDNEQYEFSLLGDYQPGNALLALRTIQVLKNLGVSIGVSAMKKGLANTKWSGRFQMIARKPYVFIDGAHNEGAAISLKKSIQTYFTNRRIIYIMGVLADKDYKAILDHTASLADCIITITPNNSRALSSTELAKEANHYCNQVLDAGHIEQAVNLALEEAKEEDIILAFGSLSYLSEVVNTLKTKGRLMK